MNETLKDEKPLQLYMQSYDYAQENGEIKELLESHRKNLDCLWDIEQLAEIYFCEDRLDIFVKKLAEKYGVERPLYVLSRTIQQVDDMRFSSKARQIANKFDYPDWNNVHSFTHHYVTDVNPSVIDTMVETLNEMQKRTDRTSSIMKGRIAMKLKVTVNPYENEKFKGYANLVFDDSHKRG